MPVIHVRHAAGLGAKGKWREGAEEWLPYVMLQLGRPSTGVGYNTVQQVVCVPSTNTVPSTSNQNVNNMH